MARTSRFIPDLIAGRLAVADPLFGSLDHGNIARLELDEVDPGASEADLVLAGFNVNGRELQSVVGITGVAVLSEIGLGRYW